VGEGGVGFGTREGANGRKFGIDVLRALSPSFGTEMRVMIAVVLRACCLAAGLWLATTEAAEPASPLIGATPERVLSQYGEPRSQMAAGDRVIYLYPRERVIFRGGVVIEVEAIVPEPVRRPPAAETPAPAPTEPVPPAGATPEVVPPAPVEAAPVAPPAPPPEPKVEIKLVRPPGSKELPPAPPPLVKAPAVPAVKPAAPVETPSVSAPPVPATVPGSSLSEANEARKAIERAAAAEMEQKAKARKEALQRLDEAARSEESPGGMFSGRTWLIIAAVIVASIAFIYWRSRHRPLDLAAGSAAGGLAAAAPASVGTNFTADMLEEIDWKRFERLVISYYSKTGVVAEPTNSGPDGAVQIKISWKGEPRPFAYVRCVANSAGLVDVKHLNELGAVLAADDIRRGYVVTLGRFTPAARGLAAEKQLTLMPGELLLEKLNALPVAARKELLRDIGMA